MLEDELREVVMQGLFERGGVVHVTGDGAVEGDLDLVAGRVAERGLVLGATGGYGFVSATGS
ncbi:MAG TPA: hypothetical protein VGN29_19690 [Solirubrobacteraceae bacterium]|nr:hypothetical protein [Solirubrobacteraceae bacterium]